MFEIAEARGSALALMLVGVVFCVAGLEQHRSGGSGGFVLIGVVFVMLGFRRLRRARSAP